MAAHMAYAFHIAGIGFGKMADTEDATRKRAAPPYVSYPSLKTMVGGFKQNGLPGRIDRSVLGNFSGAVGGQLLTALKFLHLVGSDGEPTIALEVLIAAHGTDDWPAKLGEVIRAAYGPLFQLNLQTASPAQFNERFRAVYPMEGETFRKCLTFFLHAVTDAQIQVSPYILKNKKPRTNGGGPRKPRVPRPSNGSPQDQPSSEQGGVKKTSDNPKINEKADGDDFRKKLLGKFPAFDPAWPDEIKAKWFQGFDQFMAMAKK
jgi:hypothetical protein